MRKVLFTCNRVGTGGAERVITNIANRMAQEGIQVKIACYDILPGFYYKTSTGVEIVELDKELSQHNSFFERKFYGLRNLFRLYSLVKNFHPDVIISFYTKQNCYSILCANMLHIPIICAERDHFFTCDSKMNDLLRKVFYHRADGFIHQTKWAKDYLESHYSTPSNGIILHNPLWISDYPSRKPATNEVIAMGRLAEQKNYIGILAAFQIVLERIPNACLKIYGNGEQRSYLQEVINEKHLNEHVLLMGETTDVLSAYAEADIFIMFSHGEGYPNALMEALACGVPSVASNCPIGGPAELIENGINGFLVENENINMFADRIVDLMSSEELKKKFSAAAMKIRETNSMENIYTELMQYINSILKGD